MSRLTLWLPDSAPRCQRLRAPAYAAMGSIWGPVDSMLADVFDNGMDPADAARKAQAAIEKALGMDLTVDDDADDDDFTIDGANATATTTMPRFTLVLMTQKGT